MFGHQLTIPVPDLDRTDHLLILGANPLALQRQPADRARHARPPARDPGARRQGRGDRPAAHAHRRGGRRAPLHPPGHRRAAAVRDGARARRRGAGAARPARRARATGSTRCRRSRPTSRPSAWPTRCGIAAEEIRRLARELAAAPRAAVYGRIGTTHAGVRHARELAGRRAQRADRQPRPRGRRDVPARRGRRAQHAAARRGSGRGRAARPLAQPRARACPRVFGELPVAVPGRGDRDARRGPGPRAVHGRRQPARSRRRTAARLERGARRRSSFMVAVDIYVNETTRHADVILPAPSPLAALALRRRALPARRAQRRQLLAAGARRRTGAAGRVGDARCGCRWIAGPGGRRRDARRPRPTLRGRRGADGARRRTGATSRSCSPSSSRASGPERLLDLMLRTGPYGDGFGATRRADARRRSRRRRTASTSGRSQPRMPDVLRTPSGQDRARARAARRDVARLARGARAPRATAAWC